MRYHEDYFWSNTNHFAFHAMAYILGALIRNGMMLHSLVVRAEKFGDNVALDLAEGMANHTGDYDYWDLISKFARNQLVENQIKDSRFVAVDNTKEDTESMTWKDLDKRVVGGWSGGSEPNSISLTRFRSIAGCCIGTAPQALQLVRNRIVVNNLVSIIFTPLQCYSIQAYFRLYYIVV